MTKSAMFLVAALAWPVASAAQPDEARGWTWGAQALLGPTSGDLQDTTNHNPCLDLGLHAERPVFGADRIRLRLDGLFFTRVQRRGTGVTEGVAWTRDLDTRVRGWSLGAEYLFQDLLGVKGLAAGGGLHLVRWSVDSTSTLVVLEGPTQGTVVESNTPAWNKAGLSLVADYRLSRRLRAEARILTGPYGWEGERVNVYQLGVLWTF